MELAERLAGARHPVGQPRHPRLQPLLAAGQPGRGHPPRAAPPVPPPRGLATAEGQPRRHVPAARRGRPVGRRRARARRARLPRRHRAPDRGAPQDDLRRPAAGQRAHPAARPHGGGDRRRRVVGPLWRSVLTLWQTALLAVAAAADRRDRRGAAVLRPVAVRRRPRAQRRARRALTSAGPTPACFPAHAAARLLDRRRPRRQPVRHGRRAAAGHHPPGRDGAQSATWASSSCCATSCRCPTGWSPRRRSSTTSPRPPGRLPFRADEPYRRTLNGIAARLAATAAKVLGRVVPGPDIHVELPPYDSPDELRADLDVIDTSLRSHGAGGAG